MSTTTTTPPPPPPPDPTIPEAPTSVTISPQAPYPGTQLVAAASPSAPEGITYRYQWRISSDSGSTWGAWGYAGRILSGTYVKAGQKLQARARAGNGTEVSAWKASAAVTVSVPSQNLPPTQPGRVVISPSAPYEWEDLVPAASGSIDPEGHAVTYQFRWFYSQDHGATWNLYRVLPRLDAGLTGVGEMWKVQARAFDGARYGIWEMSGAVTIR